MAIRTLASEVYPEIEVAGPDLAEVTRKVVPILKRPRILLADDHAPIVERVKALLQTDFDIVGDVGTGSDLVSEAERLQPDLIVLDISMPGLTGIEAAHKMRLAGSLAKFVFLTVHERIEFLQACVAEGALGYVAKSRISMDLVPAITDALVGRRFTSPSVAANSLAH